MCNPALAQLCIALKRRGPVGAVPVQPPPGRGQEYRSLAAFADGEVDRPCGPGRKPDECLLAAFAEDRKSAVTALDGERLDVRADGLGRPESVEGEQEDQGVAGWLPSPAAISMAPTSLQSRHGACDS